MAEHLGYWVVIVTGQGGGLPDDVRGPFYDEQDATESAEYSRTAARQVGRSDRFQVGHVEVTDAD